MKSLFVIVFTIVAFSAGSFAGGAIPGYAGAASHDELTELWKQRHYGVDSFQGNCTFCFAEDVDVVSTVGCHELLADKKGVCKTCLFNPGMLDVVLTRGIDHSHDFPDGSVPHR